MGVKYAREYSDIINELTSALGSLEGLNDFFSMNTGEWDALTSEERLECIRTLSDDLFYALGQEPFASVGSGYVKYDEQRHILKIEDGPKITIIPLV